MRCTSDHVSFFARLALYIIIFISSIVGAASLGLAGAV
jgi:hypothetical protein